jgi:riboflavin transporter FmnP
MQTTISSPTRRLTLSALFLALALILPTFTGQIPQIGKMLLPMHFPVLICGFVCGAPWGAVVGFLAPLLRSLFFGMPNLYPSAVSMAFELAVYGAVTGFLYRRLPGGKQVRVYGALLCAMVAGRLVWGLVRFLCAGLQPSAFGLSAFWAGAVTVAIPGIVLQILLIPAIILLLEKAGICGRD